MFARLLRSALLSVELFAAVGVLAVSCASNPSQAQASYQGEIVEVFQWRAFNGDTFFRITIGVRTEETRYEQFTVNAKWGSREARLFGEPGRCVVVRPGSSVNPARLDPCP